MISVAAFLIFTTEILAVGGSSGDDPPDVRPPKNRPGASQEPPACHHGHPSAVAVQPIARNRRRPPANPFDRMMNEMARDPVRGFANVMKDQETQALRATSLSPTEERRIGMAQRDRYLRQAASKGFPVYRNQRDVAYLRELARSLGKRMKNRARYPRIEVVIVDSPIPDGQSFPGGYLVFTKAMLDEPDEATVAAVVAHELAHLDRGHLNEYARREKLQQTAFQPNGPTMFDPFAMMTQGMAIGSLMMDPYRPEHEHDADCQATTWLYQEGYDPKTLAEFFERMHRRNRDQPDQGWSMIARSHPFSLDRREQVLGRLAQLQRWKPREDLGRYAENLRDRSQKRP